MTRHAWLLDALSCTAAVIAAGFGAVVLWGIFSTGFYLAHDDIGGIGAVSAGFGELILLPLTASVVANRLVARSARRSGGLILKLHRAHSLSLVSALVLLSFLVIGLAVNLAPWLAVITAAALIGIVFGVHFMLLSALLISFIWRRRTTPGVV